MSKASKSRGKPTRRAASATRRKRAPTGPKVIITGWEVVYIEETFASGEQKVVIAPCPPGKRVLGGGYFPKDYQGELGILGSWPSDKTGSGITKDGSSWAVYARNLSVTDSPSIVAYAICADA